MPDRVVMWDFDGTLGARVATVRGVRGVRGGVRGALWAQTLVEVLDERMPSHGVAVGDLRPHLQSRFPWHEPERVHTDLGTADEWWARYTPIFAGAFEAVGLPTPLAAALADGVRGRYLAPSSWRLFPDTIPVLRKLSDAGWDHVILSNHVPELENLVDALGLSEVVLATVCSAVIGYEKPHREAFRIAREVAGKPTELWMVGDNPQADVLGAEQVGIPAILVRRPPGPDVLRSAVDLVGAAAHILAE